VTCSSRTSTWTRNGVIDRYQCFSASISGTVCTSVSAAMRIQHSVVWMTAKRRYLTWSDLDSLAWRKTRSRFPDWEATKQAVCNTAQRRLPDTMASFTRRAGSGQHGPLYQKIRLQTPWPGSPEKQTPDTMANFTRRVGCSGQHGPLYKQIRLQAPWPGSPEKQTPDTMASFTRRTSPNLSVFSNTLHIRTTFSQFITSMITA